MVEKCRNRPRRLLPHPQQLPFPTVWSALTQEQLPRPKVMTKRTGDRDLESPGVVTASSPRVQGQVVPTRKVRVPRFGRPPQAAQAWVLLPTQDAKVTDPLAASSVK